MCCRLSLTAAILVVALGCSKKDPAADLPGPAYTLALRHERQGDKTLVTQELNRHDVVWVTGAGGKSNSGKQEYERFEFTEHVVAMPEGADMPTEYTRTYTTAVLGQSKEYNQNFGIAGKTVTVKKTPAGLTVTADGKPLAPLEEVRFKPMFERKGEPIRNEDILPRKAVKVNETWELDADVVAAVGKPLKFPIRKEQSRGTGKLVSVTEKDGKQWSVIEVTIELAVDGKYQTPRPIGTVTVAMTLDAVTDGSSNEGTMKTTLTGNIKTHGGQIEKEYQLKTEWTETRAPAK